MKVLICGSTGLVGSKVIQEILLNNKLSVIHALVRKPTIIRDAKYAEHLVDFNELATDAFPIDAAICCLGTTKSKAGSKKNFKKCDLEYVVEFAKLAKQKGAKTFAVISAMGANKKSIFFYNQVKGLMEESLIELNFEKLVILRPGLILGTRNELRLGEAIGKVLTFLAYPFLLGKFKHFRPIHANIIAQALISSALTEGTGTQVILSEDIKKLN